MQLPEHQRKHLLHAGLDDGGELCAAHGCGRAPRNPGNLQLVPRLHRILPDDAMLALDQLGLRPTRAQTDGNVAGHILTAQTDDGGLPHAPLIEDGDVCSAAADIDHAYTHLPLLFPQHCSARGERLQHHVTHFDVCSLYALADVSDRGHGGGDDVDLGLEAHPEHADWIANASTVIDRKPLRHDVEDLPVERNRHRPGSIYDPVPVGDGNLLYSSAHADGAQAVEGVDVFAGYPGAY